MIRQPSPDDVYVEALSSLIPIVQIKSFKPSLPVSLSNITEQKSKNQPVKRFIGIIFQADLKHFLLGHVIHTKNAG